MIRNFGFSTAAELCFGRGEVATLPARVMVLGNRVLVVRGRNAERTAPVITGLEEAGLVLSTFVVEREPDIDLIEKGIEQGRRHRAELVLSIGGGSVIDAGKALAAMIPSPTPLLDHLEVVGKGLPLNIEPLPLVAVPTTSGTGAELTRNAVIDVPEHCRKVSLRDRRLLPRLALVDPALTDSTPYRVTLASGLDAITQVIEPFICKHSNPMTDVLCRDAIPRGLAALRRLMQSEDVSARDELSWVSVCGGMALANAGLGVVHGLAGPIGGISHAPHGAICGVLLPHGLMMNLNRARDPEIVNRINQVVAWISAEFGFRTERALNDFDLWIKDSGLKGLASLGVTRADRLAAAHAAASSSSMKANPVALTEADLIELLEAAV
ncbi:alcohol dehydrogenase [Zobellella denitrificans]|uniref:iron-containing alcohol dehydrogenase n=1 Tax=Zobellella denitrificans TaxID=347534 RepID=UPI000B8C579A|nr:iron-containing alcohol dehydrogenase [Zobellella denitrificans]OXS16544.1 alcohol dehydrogenase [Zobellella denitrificans]